MKIKICFFTYMILFYFSYGMPLEIKDTALTINTSSCIVQFRIGDSGEYNINWYNDSISNISSHTFSLANGEVMAVLDTFDPYVILYQNSGQKSKYIVLLPLNSSMSEIIYENVIGYDEETKTLLYISNITNTNTINIVLLNLISEERHEFQLPRICSATNPLECIEDISCKSGNILIRYYGEDDTTLQVKAVCITNYINKNGNTPSK